MFLWIFLWLAPSAVGPSAPELGFAEHLEEAIAINQARCCFYARSSRGRSLSVSLALIGAEKVLLPYACLCDARVRRWGGLKPGLAPPFVLAQPLPNPQTMAIPACNRPPGRIWRPWLWAIRKAHRRAPQLVAEPPAVLEAWLLDRYRAALAFEAAERCQLAMYRHLLASMGHLNRQRVPYAGDPRFARLWRELLRGHAALLSVALYLDRAAQATQARGAPLLYADLPAIPWP